MSDRLRLDEVVATDADRLYAALTDPAMSDETRSPFRSLAGTTLWVAHRVGDRDSHGLCSYLLRDRDTGELVGVCGVRLGQAAAEPELGYRIAARYRRRGLATEAATAVVDECRNAGLRRVGQHPTGQHRVPAGGRTTRHAPRCHRPGQLRPTPPLHRRALIHLGTARLSG